MLEGMGFQNFLQHSAIWLAFTWLFFHTVNVAGFFSKADWEKLECRVVSFSTFAERDFN